MPLETQHATFDSAICDDPFTELSLLWEYAWEEITQNQSVENTYACPISSVLVDITTLLDVLNGRPRLYRQGDRVLSLLVSAYVRTSENRLKRVKL